MCTAAPHVASDRAIGQRFFGKQIGLGGRRYIPATRRLRRFSLRLRLNGTRVAKGYWPLPPWRVSDDRIPEEVDGFASPTNCQRGTHSPEEDKQDSREHEVDTKIVGKTRRKRTGNGQYEQMSQLVLKGVSRVGSVL